MGGRERERENAFEQTPIFTLVLCGRLQSPRQGHDGQHCQGWGHHLQSIQWQGGITMAQGRWPGGDKLTRGGAALSLSGKGVATLTLLLTTCGMKPTSSQIETENKES